MVSKYCSCDEEKWKTSGKPIRYVMPIANMLVDSATNNEFLSFMDGFSSYNQILIVVEDIP